MANKKESGPVVEAAPDQANAPEYVEVGQLRMKHGVSRAVYAGVCAAEGWKPGKAVTEAEFLAAVKEFTSAPMSGAKRKEAVK